jgi:hypothetical protein
MKGCRCDDESVDTVQLPVRYVSPFPTSSRSTHKRRSDSLSYRSRSSSQNTHTPCQSCVPPVSALHPFLRPRTCEEADDCICMASLDPFGFKTAAITERVGQYALQESSSGMVEGAGRRCDGMTIGSSTYTLPDNSTTLKPLTVRSPSHIPTFVICVPPFPELVRRSKTPATHQTRLSAIRNGCSNTLQSLYHPLPVSLDQTNG